MLVATNGFAPVGHREDGWGLNTPSNASPPALFQGAGALVRLLPPLLSIHSLPADRQTRPHLDGGPGTSAPAERYESRVARPQMAAIVPITM